MEYKIEKDVPVPNIASGKGKQVPFAVMEIGDSVLVTNDSGVRAARASASWHSKVTDKRFITRTVDGGVRIWRVS